MKMSKKKQREKEKKIVCMKAPSCIFSNHIFLLFSILLLFYSMVRHKLNKKKFESEKQHKTMKRNYKTRANRNNKKCTLQIHINCITRKWMQQLWPWLLSIVQYFPTLKSIWITDYNNKIKLRPTTNIIRPATTKTMSSFFRRVFIFIRKY